jgi:prepilin-type N-terminal cleavage/methylation domain-containing protein
MKKGFTLIELLVVITIIAILAGLTLGAGSALRDKAARSRASAEIAAFDTALERYKIDNGDYPDVRLISHTTGIYDKNTSNYSGNTVNVTAGTADARGTVPGDENGRNGTRFLFACLLGRANLNDTDRSKIAYPQYIEVKAGQVSSDGTYFKDPYGNAYGYYYDTSRSTGTGANQDQNSLFNVVEPDIWSIGSTNSSSTAPSTDSSNAAGYAVYLKWIKNWASQ